MIIYFFCIKIWIWTIYIGKQGNRATCWTTPEAIELLHSGVENWPTRWCDLIVLHFFTLRMFWSLRLNWTKFIGRTLISSQRILRSDVEDSIPCVWSNRFMLIRRAQQCNCHINLDRTDIDNRIFIQFFSNKDRDFTQIGKTNVKEYTSNVLAK